MTEGYIFHGDDGCDFCQGGTGVYWDSPPSRPHENCDCDIEDLTFDYEEDTGDEFIKVVSRSVSTTYGEIVVEGGDSYQEISDEGNTIYDVDEGERYYLSTITESFGSEFDGDTAQIEEFFDIEQVEMEAVQEVEILAEDDNHYSFTLTAAYTLTTYEITLLIIDPDTGDTSTEEYSAVLKNPTDFWIDIE